MPVNTKTLYETLKKDTNYSGIGNTLESFKAYFSKPENANKLYSTLSADENYEGIGKDINSFTSYFGLKGDTTVTLPKQPSVTDLYNKGNQAKPVVDYKKTGDVIQTDNTNVIQPQRTAVSIEAQTKRKQFVDKAIDNAIIIKNKKYGVPEERINFDEGREQILAGLRNKDIAIDENGKIKRTAGFGESFKMTADKIHQKELDDAYLANLNREDAITYLNNKMKYPELYNKEDEAVPSGVLGALGEFGGENAAMIGKGTVGAMVGGYSAMTGGASFGTFMGMIDDAAAGGYSNALQRNYTALKSQDPNISDDEAYDKAHKAALVGEVVGIGTNALLSTTIFAKEPKFQKAADGFINGIKQSAKHTLETSPKMIGSGIAGSLINDATAKVSGVDVTLDETLKNASESAKAMAVLHFGLGVMPALVNGVRSAIPNYLRPQLENILSLAPRDEVQQFYSKAEQEGVIPQGTTEKIITKLDEFGSEKQKLDGLKLDEENKAAITGKMLQIKGISSKISELEARKAAMPPALYESIDEVINTHKEEIAAIDKQIGEMQKSGKPLDSEIDNLTGDKLVYTEMPKEPTGEELPTVTIGGKKSKPETKKSGVTVKLPQVNEETNLPTIEVGKNEITIPEENTGNKQVDIAPKEEIIADAELDKNKQPTEEIQATNTVDKGSEADGQKTKPQPKAGSVGVGGENSLSEGANKILGLHDNGVSFDLFDNNKLREIAKENGIDLPEGAKNSDIIEALKNKRNEATAKGLENLSEKDFDKLTPSQKVALYKEHGITKDDGSPITEKDIESNPLQYSYDFMASSDSGKWNSANSELESAVQGNRKQYSLYKLMNGEFDTFKEFVDFINSKNYGDKIEYTERMKRADDMSPAERKSAVDSYNKSVEDKAGDKSQKEKDILDEHGLKDETEYSPHELVEKFPLKGVQKVIWDIISPIVKKLGIKVKFSSSRITEGFDGSSNPMNGEVLLRPSTLKNGRLGEVLVHEVVHSLTTKIISRVNSGVETGLTSKQVAAVKGLGKLYKSIEADNNLQNKYPVKDIFEFIAHLTNDTFVKELQSKDRNFIQKVVDFISDILGLSDANELAKKYLKDIIHDGTFLEKEGITVVSSDYAANVKGAEGLTPKQRLLEAIKNNSKTTAEKYHDLKSKGKENDFTKAVEQSLKETTKAETPTTNTGVEEGSVGVGREKSDADIEKRMAEIEGAKIGTPELSEFNTLEKEMEKRERATVFNVPLEKVNDAVDTLMNKEKEQPNGYGSFIEKRDARETKEVADRYLNAKELTDAELKKDFSDAVRGNPTTWYADGLKMREALKEATNRGIDTKDMLAEVTKVYEDAGYDTKTAKSVVANMLKPIFEGSQKVNEKQIAEQPLKETTKAETKTSNVGVEAGSVGVGGDVEAKINKVADEYLYHGTGEGAFRRIREEGLTPQGEKYLYFADKEQYAKTYAQRKGNSFGDRVLRVKKSDAYLPDENTTGGDFKIKNKINPNDIEIKHNGKWIPIQEFADENIGIMPISKAVEQSLSTPKGKEVVQPSNVGGDVGISKPKVGKYDGVTDFEVRTPEQLNVDDVLKRDKPIKLYPEQIVPIDNQYSEKESNWVADRDIVINEGYGSIEIKKGDKLFIRVDNPANGDATSSTSYKVYIKGRSYPLSHFIPETAEHGSLDEPNHFDAITQMKNFDKVISGEIETPQQSKEQRIKIAETLIPNEEFYVAKPYNARSGFESPQKVILKDGKWLRLRNDEWDNTKDYEYNVWGEYADKNELAWDIVSNARVILKDKKSTNLQEQWNKQFDYLTSENKKRVAGKAVEQSLKETTKAETKPELKTESKPKTKLQKLADKIENEGWEKVVGLPLPNLPEGTQKAGFNSKEINKALANAIRAVDKLVESGKDIYESIEEGFKIISDYYNENTKSWNKEAVRKEYDNFFNQFYKKELENVPPIKETKITDDKSGDGKESLSYKNVIERSKVLTKAQKDILVNDPARFYNEQKIEVVKKFATDLVNELGADRAEVESTNMNNEMQPVERTFILGAVADHWARLGQEAEAKGKLGDAEFYADKEIEANNKYKQVFQKLSLLGRDYGRAINVFSDIYKLSGFALERKLKNATDEYNKAVAPQVDSKVTEVKDALKEKPTDLQEVISEINNDELTQTQNEKIADLEKQITDLKKEINTRDNTKVGSKSNPLKIKRITSAEGYSEALKRLRSKTNSGIAPEDFKDMVYIGTYHIENGVTRFADWVGAMVKAAGKKYQDHFVDIYKKSKEDALERGADKSLFDDDNAISGYYKSANTAKEYKTLETERNRQLQKVGALKDKLASLEKDGLQDSESKEAEKDTPEIEALKQRVKDLESSLRKKEIDAKTTETNIEKLSKELIRVRERRAKEKTEKKPPSKELSDEEKSLIAQIKSENEKWGKEKQSAAQAKKDYSALETERNRQIKRAAELKEKLDLLKSGKRPKPKTSEPKKDTPELENLKAEIKAESEKLSAIESQQKRVNDLEKELQRLQDRKAKEPKETTEREVSDREKELKEQIDSEKKKINEEWKASPEYQAETDAKKMAALTKRKAVADFNKVMSDNPDRARIIAPKLAAKRILNDAKSNLDTPSMANEKTYLQKLVKVVRDKAAEYYKEKKENVSNVNDMLAFAIANGKKDYAIWDRTKEELERQIDADNKLSDTEKAEVKSFLEDYTDSVFDTFLTDRQQENVIREKLIEAGYKTDKIVNGKNVTSVDWSSVTKSAKNIAEAKEQVKKAIMDLGFSEKEAKPTIDAILAKMDTKITDKRTKEINSILNKSALNKVKSALGISTRKAQIKKLMDWNDKGLLTNDGVKEILSEQLGVKSLTQAEINEIKRLNDLANDEGINQFRRKKYEEEINWMLQNKQGNMGYLQTMEGYMSQLLGAASTQIQNISGLERQLSSIGSTMVKTSNVKDVLSVTKKALQQSNSNLRTVLKGDVSRGIAFSDITANTEGEPRTRYLEYGKAKLLGILPDLYVKRNGKTVNLNILNEGWRKVKYITRGMEAMDTIGSTLSAKLDQYATLKISYKKWFPQKTSAEIETMVKETINSIPMADARSEAVKKFDNEGITPTKYQINRAADEILERNLNVEYSKRFYEAAKEAEKVAKLKFESQGIEPTEAQLQKEVQLNMGSSEPIDLVAKGERKALRETGKVSTGGITGFVMMLPNALNKEIKSQVKNTKAGSVNKGLANASDFAYSTLFAFANGAARWTEMGLELSPYGLAKGGTYKFKSYKELQQGNVERAAELSDYGTDMILRGIQGTAQTLGAFYLMALYNKMQDDDDEKAVITGESEENNYNTQRIQQAVNTNRTLEIAGHTVPLDLLGSSSVPMMMWADYLKYQNSPDMDAERAAWYITGTAYLVNMASATYSTRAGQYGGIVDAIVQGRDDKYAPKLGSIVGKAAGNLVIPFNRVQSEIGSMFKKNANTGVTFGENLLQQLSVYGGFDKSHPAFDYRGRTIEIQEYSPSSLNGIVNMFEKGKKTDNIDRFLAKINFGYTDAYKQTKSQDDYKYSIINENGTSRGFTDEEYYTFKLNTANKFNELMKNNAKQIEKLQIVINGIKNEDETIAAQKSLVSDLLSEAKEQALMVVQKETNFTPDYKSMKRAEERENRKINRQKSKIKLIGLDD